MFVFTVVAMDAYTGILHKPGSGSSLVGNRVPVCSFPGRG